MGSRFHPYLATWFERGLSDGSFVIPGGRNIILNQFPRLMPERRLLASAGVEPDSLREFFLALNPITVTVSDSSPAGLKLQLASERDRLPALRKARLAYMPACDRDCWYVYTPPLSVMRESWREYKVQAGLA